MPSRTQKTWFGVVLDAPDARELAHFYQRLLGWRIFKRVRRVGGSRPVRGRRRQLLVRHRAGRVPASGDRPGDARPGGAPLLSLRPLTERPIAHRQIAPGQRLRRVVAQLCPVLARSADMNRGGYLSQPFLISRRRLTGARLRIAMADTVNQGPMEDGSAVTSATLAIPMVTATASMMRVPLQPAPGDCHRPSSSPEPRTQRPMRTWRCALA